MPGLESSFWGGIRLQRRPGEEKNFQVPKVVFDLVARNKADRQDKPTQTKGSLRGQTTFSESGWCLAEAVDISLGDRA